jgi:hypothetical protein
MFSAFCRSGWRLDVNGFCEFRRRRPPSLKLRRDKHTSEQANRTALEPPTQAFLEKLRSLAQREKFLSLSDTLAKLGSGSTEDLVLEACEKIMQIQKIAQTNMVVLIWQG